MSVITFDGNNNKNESNIVFFKNEDKYVITSIIIDKLNWVNKKKKILYFNYSYNEKELLEKFKIFNNKNIIIVNKFSVTVDSLEKYLKYSKPSYICVDYFKLNRINRSLKIGNESLKYTLNKLKKYMDNYDTIFIVVINEESK